MLSRRQQVREVRGPNQEARGSCSQQSMLLWGAAREFRLEAEAEELRAEVKKLETELDRAHNDMASSLEREDRFEALSERLIADNKKMRRLNADRPVTRLIVTPGDDLGRFRYLELCNIHVVLAVGLELNFRKSPNPPLAFAV